MPTTYNGVGTHYYGKANVKARTGVCKKCGTQTELVSYDTRLFFVLVFIPIIPLGRKRIIDYCPRCTNHYAIDAQQWEVSGQLNASEALDRFVNEPTAETAAGSHAQMLSFLQYEEAKKFRDRALAKLPGDGQLRSELGWQLTSAGQYDEAQRLFDEALRLRPDLPAARAGKAQYLMGAGQLDAARDLLDFMIVPGAGQLYDLNPLLVLFESSSKAGRHEEVLEMAPHLMQELPHIGSDFWFMNIVRKAEKAVRPHESLLPRGNRSLFSLLFSNSRDFAPATRRWTRVTVVVLAMVAGILAYNEVVRRHRHVTVLNYTGVPAQISVDGQDPQAFDRTGFISVVEGKHEFHITAPIDSTETLIVESRYFERWFNRPVWILNVNGEAALILTRVVYAVQPVPSTPSFLIGKTTFAMPQVDYLFDEDLPKKLELSGNNPLTKSRLQVVDLPVDDLLIDATEQETPDVLTLAEKKISRLPSERLLRSYVDLAMRRGQRERAEKFLEGGLARRPINVVWHRAYQDITDTREMAKNVFARYEKLATDEPNSAAAWYLFARHDTDGARRDRSLDKAYQLDPSLPWIVYAKASQALDRTDWPEAEVRYKEFLRLNANDEYAPMGLIQCLLAQHKYADAEEVCDRWSHNKGDGVLIALVRFWCKHEQNVPVDIAAFSDECSRAYPLAVITEAQALIETNLLYAAADWLSLRQKLANPQFKSLSPQQGALRLLSVYSGSELENSFARPADVESPSEVLAVSLAFTLAGNNERAAEWRNYAVALLANGDQGDRESSAALSAKTPTPIEHLRSVWINPFTRPVILVALAQKFPAKKDEYLAEAARWQMLPIGHYWLVERFLPAHEAGRPR